MMATKTTHSPRSSTIMASEGWTGRVIARILPTDGEADYEYIHKPQLRRIDPHQLMGIINHDDDIVKQERTPLDLSQVGDLSRAALTSEEIRWTTMDILLTKQPGHYSTGGESESDEQQVVHMNRATQELVSSAFQRLELSVSKKLERTLSQDEIRVRKKLERKQSKQQESSLFSSKQTVYNPSGDEWNVQHLCNGDFFRQVATEYAPGEIMLHVSFENTTIPLAIDSCPPSIVAVRVFDNFEGRVYVGIPLVVDLDILYASGAIVDWYVGGELVCSDCVLYTPTRDNLGKEVAVIIRSFRPGHDGHEYKEAYRFVHEVEERPFNGILPLRQDWTRSKRVLREKDSLRVMTFNILANEKAYMDLRENNSGLYPYCDDEFLNRDRRMPLILHEILAHEADVVCLQEVDASTFASLFHPALAQNGYQGYYRKKMGTREGIAMFWSLDVFEEASDEDLQSISIQKLFPTSKEDCLEDWESMREICEFLEQDDDLKRIVTEKLGHVVQIATLTLKDASSSPRRKLVVSNTHLFFHSMGHHIRLLQLFVICHALEKERQGHPLLFCGDFNSTPHSGGVRLLFERIVAPDHHSAWKHLDTFSWEEENHGAEKEEATTGIASGSSSTTTRTPPTIRLPDSFPLLTSGYAEFPVFTHYITDFCGTLDYILASQPSETEPYGLVCQKSAPMPSKAEIEKHVAMPGECWPSDHVSLACDFKFQHQAKNEL
jgi:mRNA deadenylase 3'-5' endonuclease subunit Ccr4